MIKRERKFYSEDFKEQALSAYHNSNASMLMVAERFGLSRNTFSSWVFRKRVTESTNSKKRVKLAALNSLTMKEEELSLEVMKDRLKELEHQLSVEKMRSESLSKMIDIAERELKIDIRKKTGAKQSLR
jgi:transposase-like protein